MVSRDGEGGACHNGFGYVGGVEVMGDFGGHALPGAFFITMGLWWYIKIILLYTYKKQARICYLQSKAFFQRTENLEGIVFLGMVLTGVTCMQIFSESKESQLNKLLRFHHLTVYLFFGLWALINILCFNIRSIPVFLTKLMLANAFLVNAFIFYNHTHGRQMVDILVHQLLCLASFLAGLVAFLELLFTKSIVLELLRSSLTILQGSWLWQLGFVLFTPIGGPAWDLNDHNNSLFLIICFCWHYAVTYIIMGVVSVAVTWVVKWKVKNLCPSEFGLLKNAERDEESEEEM
ncbi:transmembrane protein 45A-like isoform 2-T2 [Thomomys bottae]